MELQREKPKKKPKKVAVKRDEQEEEIDQSMNIFQNLDFAGLSVNTSTLPESKQMYPDAHIAVAIEQPKVMQYPSLKREELLETPQLRATTSPTLQQIFPLQKPAVLNSMYSPPFLAEKRALVHSNEHPDFYHLIQQYHTCLNFDLKNINILLEACKQEIQHYIENSYILKKVTIFIE